MVGYDNPFGCFFKVILTINPQAAVYIKEGSPEYGGD
jgi:hypothetical protein